MNEIKYLSWDSEFFGFPIYRIVNFEETENHTLFIEKIEDKGHVEALILMSDVDKVRILEGIGFRFAALQIDYQKDLRMGNSVVISNEWKFKLCDESDLVSLHKIASTSFEETRFSIYPYKKESANKLYGLWVEKAVSGTFDNECYCLLNESGILGFVTLRFNENVSKIGLIAVREDARGKGIGKALCKYAFNVLTSKGYTECSVATQGNNINANALYSSCGFRLKRIYGWFYYNKV